MISDAVYLETIKNCARWNNKNIVQRVSSNTGILDQQTCIEQKPTDQLYRNRLERYKPANPHQVCSYKAKRYKRSKEVSSELCEFNYFRATYPEINNVINTITNPPIDPLYSEAIEQSSMPLRSSNIGIKANNYEGFEDGLDYDLDDFSDQDVEDDWGSRRKKKKNGRDSGRLARRTAANYRPNVNAAPAIKTIETPREPAASNAAAVSSSSTESRPFICHQCGARYKSRPGLSYHMIHVHKEEAIGMEMEKILAASSPIDISTVCDICQGDVNLNKKTSQPEQLVNCHDCGRAAHPSCVGFTPNMIISTKKYGWQCIECKSCTFCGTSDNDADLLFCDECDRGFHLYCLKPPLKEAPEGNWSCQLCQKEFGQKK